MAVPLSRREREILEIIFSTGGEAPADLIRERLSDAPSYWRSGPCSQNSRPKEP